APTPWGQLIRDAREAADDPLSIRDAAQEAGISYGTWGNIERGYASTRPGEYQVVRGYARSVARMCAIVGVTPERLEAAGRPDAARILREIRLRQQDDPASDGERLAQWIAGRIVDANGDAADVSALIKDLGLPGKPGQSLNVDAYRRAARATGASVAEVMAATGIIEPDEGRPEPRAGVVGA
ncbi:MAG TPA: helix-turn-helix transcriptional regulator, partial [Streptosporangiaceae bacterium]|nr:helix-turn-helix transcriptional regulator [Streptosporangiaceae bacterium]